MANLIIDIKDEYKIKIENGNDFRESIFSEVYISASKNIEEIIRQSKLANGYDPFNNIIAFTGERGKGKSSSMISFQKALIGNCKEENKAFFKKSLLIKENKFATIDVIDPSLFRGEESLFEIIISKMFSKFQDVLKNNNDEINQESKRIIIKEFQKVYNNLKVLNGGKQKVYDKEAIEALSDLAYGTNLSSSFSKLVDVFLKNIYDQETKYLVIAIDDFDLNISGAYQMLEDIRQFLIQKNIILLIACKMEQLREAVENELIKEYGFALNQNKENLTILINDGRSGISTSFKEKEHLSINLLEIKNKANKYIEKLFPFSHQLSMPEIKNYCKIYINNEDEEEDVESYIWDEYENSLIEKNSTKAINIKLDKDYYGNDLQTVILDLIFDKTEIFINKPQFRLNSIIPSTLRELHNLIGIFTNEYSSLEKFKDYILEVANTKLSNEFSFFFKELEKQDFQMMNIFFLNLLGDMKSKFDFPTRTDFNFLFKAKNPANTSLGDIYSILKKCYQNVRPSNNSALLFLDLTSIYYAIRVKLIESKNFKNLKPVLKGGYFNKYNNVFPLERHSNERRDWVVFSRELLSQFKSSSTEEYWIGFFIPYLGIVPEDFREIEESFYFRDLYGQGGQIKHVTFSPLAPLSQVYFPEEIWNSFVNNNNDDEFYNNSLYKEIEEWNKNNNLKFLLNNIMFYNEFIDEFNKATKGLKESLVKNRDLNDDYENRIFYFFFESSRKVMQSILDKYPFLKAKLSVNAIINNPIYKFWYDNRENLGLSKKIDLLFSGNETNKTLNVKNYEIVNETIRMIDNNDIVKLLNLYIKRITTHPSSLTITYLIKKLDLLENPPISLINQIKRLQEKLKNANKIEHDSIIKEIIELLRNVIING